MNPEIFVTYLFLFKEHNVKEIVKRANTFGVKASYQMLVLNALKKYKLIEEHGGVGRMLDMPEEWKIFIAKLIN